MRRSESVPSDRAALIAAAICATAVFLPFAINLGTQVKLSPSDWAAWAQAVFSAGAIAVTVWTVLYQRNREEAKAREAMADGVAIRHEVVAELANVCDIVLKSFDDDTRLKLALEGVDSHRLALRGLDEIAVVVGWLVPFKPSMLTCANEMICLRTAYASADEFKSTAEVLIKGGSKQTQVLQAHLLSIRWARDELERMVHRVRAGGPPSVPKDQFFASLNDPSAA